jgi:hypothetical protein
VFTRTRIDITLYVQCLSCCLSDDTGMKMSLTVEWEILCSHSDISAVEGFRMYSKMRVISMGSGGVAPRLQNRSPWRSNVPILLCLP